MGTVYQAIDRRTGALVAVKILSVKNVADVGRFDQEARLLAELGHPGIVRYVDHGLTSHGDPYIAMEWLEGETLDQRLARGKLAPAGVAHLAARVLEALAAAHEHNIVHRDIKPSNVFLAGWRLFDPRIIDFGVARRVEDPRRYTRRGATVGTPSYSSPEQARADATIDGRADIFSLGCVLFECLTGRPPFYGPSPKEVLTAICMTPVPILEERCEGVDPPLARLIDKMLIQDRRKRPGSARELAAQFRDIAARLGTSDLADGAQEGTPLPGRPPQGLGFGEARMLCAALLAFEGRRVNPPQGTEARRWREAQGLVSRRITSATGELVDGREADDARGPAVRALADDLGLEVETIGGGAYVLWSHLPGYITDQTREMARAALRLRASFPEARISLSVGRASLLAGSLVGSLLDRLAELLPDIPGSVRLGASATRLLPARLTVRGPDGASWLRAENEGPGADVTLVAVEAGEPPLVGRDRDLELLLDSWQDCASAERARLILLEAGPGMGKTRLARLLVGAARQREPEASVLLLRARREDSSGKGSLLAPLLGPEAALPAQAPAAARQAALVERLSQTLARRPMLLVLDDLQWADRTSLQLIELALRELRQRPLLVVAFARPDLAEQWPQLFSELAVRGAIDRLRLLPLGLEAGQVLLRRQLGRIPGWDVEDYVFSRWEGNPLFLRELALVAEPGLLMAPDCVLGEVEPRLLALDEEPRRVLRAASLFGERFEFEAVLSLLGLKGRRALEDTLSVLVEADVLRPSPSAPGVYVFRHRLLREAAFSMLTPADRALGMARAKQWLEEAGRTIPELLVEGSFRRVPASGGDRATASA